MLTGALQDHGRAVVIGELTYGKGMVNTVTEYKGLGFRLKVTTGRYYTPKSRNLEGNLGRKPGSKRTGGIQPDREVRLTQAQTAAVWAALREEEPPSAHRQAVAWLSQHCALRQPGIVPPGDDPQLAAAIAALREVVAADSNGGK